MPRNEIVTKVLDAVVYETDINAEQILSHNTSADVVEARHLFIHILYAHGFQTARIAQLCGLTPRAVNYANTRFNDRLGQSKYLRNTYESIKNKLRN